MNLILVFIKSCTERLVFSNGLFMYYHLYYSLTLRRTLEWVLYEVGENEAKNLRWE